MSECLTEHAAKICDFNIDLKERIRSIFYLRNIECDLAAHALSKAMYDKSELLAHEAAYCLGQMKRTCVIPALLNVLKNSNLPVVVRHEAGEALGAIGDISCLKDLGVYSKDEHIEVAETCEIARDRILYFSDSSQSETCNSNSLYGSVDPAPPHSSRDLNFLDSLLIDESASLFDRYRSMFALRDIGSDQCIMSLVKGFQCSSALFKHEIAFVLGQMRNEISSNALIDTMENINEHPMVRHECAEALGNIATPICTDYLTTKLNDPHQIVRESCYVALDIAYYQNSDDLQYV